MLSFFSFLIKKIAVTDIQCDNGNIFYDRFSSLTNYTFYVDKTILSSYTCIIQSPIKGDLSDIIWYNFPINYKLIPCSLNKNNKCYESNFFGDIKQKAWIHHIVREISI